MTFLTPRTENQKFNLAFRNSEDYLKREKMVNRHLVFDNTRDNVSSIGKMSVYNNLIKFPICTTNIHMEYFGFLLPLYFSGRSEILYADLREAGWGKRWGA